MAGLAQAAAGLCPSEHCLDPLADSLRDTLPRMAHSTPIDGRASAGVVLGHLRGDVPLAQERDEGCGVAVLVDAQGDAMAPLSLICVQTMAMARLMWQCASPYENSASIYAYTEVSRNSPHERFAPLGTLSKRNSRMG